MPIFHFRMQKLSRAHGRSAVAAAAYRAGERLTDARTTRTHDYTRRSGVVRAELVGWTGDRAALWNAAEAADKRKDATPARELVVSLPHELSPVGRLDLACALARDVRAFTGGAVDFAVHHPSEHPKADQRNHHVHIQWTTRAVDDAGRFAAKKADPFQGLGGPKAIYELRERAARLTNQALDRERCCWQRVDPRSYEDRDAEQLPELRETPTEHLGPKWTALERRGVATSEGDRKREAEAHNAAVRRDDVLRYRLAAAAVDELAPAAALAGPEGNEARAWRQGAQAAAARAMAVSSRLREVLEQEERAALIAQVEADERATAREAERTPPTGQALQSTVAFNPYWWNPIDPAVPTARASEPPMTPTPSEADGAGAWLAGTAGTSEQRAPDDGRHERGGPGLPPDASPDPLLGPIAAWVGGELAGVVAHATERHQVAADLERAARRSRKAAAARDDFARSHADVVAEAEWRYRVALAAVYRDPAAAQRTFAVRAGAGGWDGALAELRAAPERFGALHGRGRDGGIARLLLGDDAERSGARAAVPALGESAVRHRAARAAQGRAAPELARLTEAVAQAGAVVQDLVAASRALPREDDRLEAIGHAVLAALVDTTPDAPRAEPLDERLEQLLEPAHRPLLRRAQSLARGAVQRQAHVRHRGRR